MTLRLNLIPLGPELESHYHLRLRVPLHSSGLGRALPELNSNECLQLKFLSKYAYSLPEHLFCQTMFCIGIFHPLTNKELREDPNRHQGYAMVIHIILQCYNPVLALN